MNVYAIVFVAITSAVALVLPRLSYSYLYFGVHVQAGFRESQRAKQILIRYRLHVLVWTAVALFATRPVHGFEVASMAAPLMPLIGAEVGWVFGNRLTKPHASQSSAREALVTSSDRLPWWAWTGIGPFAVLAGVAFYLNAVWDRIPARFPIHWDLKGHPNGWVTKTPLHIYGEIALAALLLLFLLGTGLAIYFNVRRSSMQIKSLATVIGTMYLLAYTFGAGSLLGVVRLPLWAFLLPGLIFIPLSIGFYYHSYSQPDDGPAENTPDNCWHSGAIYYNPEDPSLLVEKRTGVGYTLNFANQVSWLLIAGFITVLTTILVGILWAQQ